jgi:hypothetical protein
MVKTRTAQINRRKAKTNEKINDEQRIAKSQLTLRDASVSKNVFHQIMGAKKQEEEAMGILGNNNQAHKAMCLR